MANEPIGNCSSIGQLSTVSNSDEEDQRLPIIPSSRRPKRKPLAMATVDEHVLMLDRCPYNHTTVRNGGTPPRPKDGKDLGRLVQRIYSEGSRSPQLISLVRNGVTPIPMRIVTTASEYILRVWENGTVRSQSLTNYIASLLHRLSPSVITLLIAIYYVGRLRKLFRTAKGEAGCSHRLFTIALLIAYRYHQSPGTVNESFYCIWSSYTNGIFAAADILRMEMEFVAFLKFKLYVSIVEFEYFVDRVFNCDGGQVVPRCLDIGELTKPMGTTTDSDAAVPDNSNCSI